MSQKTGSRTGKAGKKRAKFKPSPKLVSEINRLAKDLGLSRRRTLKLVEGHVMMGRLNRAHRALKREFDAWLPPELRKFKKAMLGGFDKFMRKVKAEQKLKTKKTA